jgi:hypothetical protein
MKLSQAAREAQRKQQQRWRDNNREHYREYHRRWRAKNRDKVNEHQHEWQQRNPEKVREYNRRYWERKAQQMEATPTESEPVTGNSNATVTQNHCPVCGEPIEGKKKYCSPRCKQKAYRLSRKEG